MEFRVLGPLEIRDDDGGELPLGPRRERALLALLLLHANEVVSLDRIVDDLWGEGAPPTAEKIVRNEVSHLRRLIDGYLVTVGRGYRLDVASGSMDMEQFEALAARGRHELDAGRAAAAAEALAAGLSLWRGPPFEEFAYEEFARGDIIRLQELRAAALEDQIEAQLALGLHTQTVPELEQLVQHYPLRERLRRQLMLALYRSGRQAEALEQYRLARMALVEELGLEPTEELRQLERAILAHDPALAPPRPPTTATQAEVVERWRSRKPLLRPRVVAAFGFVILVAAVVATAVRLLSGGNTAAVTVGSDSVAVIDPGSGRILDDVAVGDRPIAVAFGAGSVWVANAGDGTLSKIEPRTHTLVATIGLGVPASDAAVGEGSVWVVSGSEGALLRIDPRTNVPLDRIDLAGSNALAPAGAYCVAVGAGSVWVGSGSWRVLRIDPATAKITASIPVGHLPIALAVAGGDVWAALEDGRTVRIDPRGNTITGTAVGPEGPLSLATGAGAVWVGDERGTIWRINQETVSVTGAFSAPPRPLALAVTGHDVWAGSSETAAMTRIDARSGKLLQAVNVHGRPLDVAAGAGALWVTVGRSEDGGS